MLMLLSGSEKFNINNKQNFTTNLQALILGAYRAGSLCFAFHNIFVNLTNLIDHSPLRN